MKKSTVKNYIKRRKYLFWSTNDYSNVSDELALENILNYGDFDDVKEIITILGSQKAGSIFFKQVKSKRCNYRPEIANYFKLYFGKYAFRNTK